MNIFNKVTIQTLKKNKVRTLVTIIGIILSAAMFTAVTTTVSSFQEYMLNIVRATDGDWHVALKNMTDEETEILLADERVQDTAVMQHVGYSTSYMEESQNDEKPYICVTAADASITNMLPIRLIEGRMPQNSTEILVPKHLSVNGGVYFTLGQTLTLELGQRMYGNTECFQSKSYQANSNYTDENGAAIGSVMQEEIIANESRTYTIAGFYERPSFEPYSAPGYTLLTIADDKETAKYSDVYLTLYDLNDSRDFRDEYVLKYSEYVTGAINSDLLRFSGSAMESSYNQVLYSMAAIFIGIIMFGSIALIYNAFSISLSERTKQFGLMKSVGATKKQIMGSVLFEGILLSAIAIPIGIIFGLFGIGVTLKLLSGAFGIMWGSGITGESVIISFELQPSVISILIAAIVCIITVLISAYIPARRAVRMSSIEAIRQSNDIAVKARAVKGGKLAGRLFGLPGMLASKNFRRNKKKYRATIVSLFASIVLFISASSFCIYLTDSITSVVATLGYDVRYTIEEEKLGEFTAEELSELFRQEDEVNEALFAYNRWIQVKTPKELLTKEYLDCLQVESDYNTSQGYETEEFDNHLTASIHFIEDDVYRDYLSNAGYDVERYMNTDEPVGLINDTIEFYNRDDGRFYSVEVFEQDEFETFLLRDDYYDEDADETSETNEKTKNIKIGGELKEGLFILNNYNNDIIITYPFSAMNTILQGFERQRSDTVRYYFKCKDAYKAIDNITELLGKHGLSTTNLYNAVATEESNRALVLVIEVFSYGFIVLISLIAAANVFNTISTNINLRRREFAMLRSTGLTKRGMNRMMNYECLLYGMKSLLYGIPVSIGITWLIYKAVNDGYAADFYVPWSSIAIAAGSVFAVVFSTIIYSMSKVKKDNPIDALRNENL